MWGDTVGGSSFLDLYSWNFHRPRVAPSEDDWLWSRDSRDMFLIPTASRDLQPAKKTSTYNTWYLPVYRVGQITDL